MKTKRKKERRVEGRISCKRIYILWDRLGWGQPLRLMVWADSVCLLYSEYLFEVARV